MADVEKQGQTDLLRIDTAMPDVGSVPAFLVSRVQGSEGISVPFSYEVTLLRSNQLADFEPRQLIGTACSFSINIRDDDDPQGPELVTRKGVFEHLERVSGDTLGFRRYYGRIVPAFKLMGNEVRYRVFENLDPVKIIEQSLSEFSHMRFSTRLLKTEFPRLEYCVQFGETTFAFVSRLMARFGMWYFFDHDQDPQSETLVIGQSNVGNFRNATFSTVDLLDKRPERNAAVYNVIRKYQPSSTEVDVGGFNPLKPIEPFQGSANLQPDFDVTDGGTSQRFTRSSFADPVLSQKEATDLAKARLQSEEAAVYQVTADSNNASFLAGRTFVINEDKTNATAQDKDVPTDRLFGGDHPKYLITYMTLLATVGHHGHNALTTIADLWKDITKTAGAGDSDDITAAITNGMLSNYIQGQQQQTVADLVSIGANTAKLVPTLLSSSLSSLLGLAPNIISAIKNVGDAHGTQFGCSVIAVPFSPQRNVALPPPVAAPRPVAHGPHLAVVIGDDGAKASDGVDVHADALGRVRVRFPWDPGPPEPSAFGPFETGKATCWVRVSEGWAGASYGSQFLPRIGQQVLVSFLDGDPEQPVITGRIYAASRGPTDLPFPSPSAQGKGLTMDDWRNPVPSAQLTRSGLKTRSTPSPDGPGAGFHLLRLDDNKGKEQFLIRSQGRTDVTSLRSYYETTNGNRHLRVQAGKDDKGNTVGGGLFVTTGGELDLHVGDHRYEDMDKNFQSTVKGDMITDVQGKVDVYAGKTFHLSADSIVLKASKKISIQVGASDIVITPMAVYIDGALIKDNSPGSPDTMTSETVQDALDAATADPGDPPNWLELQPKGGGGGGRKSHTAEVAHALRVTKGSDGKLVLGDPAVSKIKVDASDPKFAEGVVADYDRLARTDDGHALIDQINSSNNPVTVVKPNPPYNPPMIATEPSDPRGATQAGQPTGMTDSNGQPTVGTGKGSPSTVLYDPASFPPADSDAPGDNSSSKDALQQGLADAAQDVNGTNPPNTFHGKEPPPKPAPPKPAGKP